MEFVVNGIKHAPLDWANNLIEFISQIPVVELPEVRVQGQLLIMTQEPALIQNMVCLRHVYFNVNDALKKKTLLFAWVIVRSYESVS